MENKHIIKDTNPNLNLKHINDLNDHNAEPDKMVKARVVTSSGPDFKKIKKFNDIKITGPEILDIMQKLVKNLEKVLSKDSYENKWVVKPIGKTLGAYLSIDASLIKLFFLSSSSISASSEIVIIYIIYFYNIYIYDIILLLCVI